MDVFDKFYYLYFSSYLFGVGFVRPEGCIYYGDQYAGLGRWGCHEGVFATGTTYQVVIILPWNLIYHLAGCMVNANLRCKLCVLLQKKQVLSRFRYLAQPPLICRSLYLIACSSSSSPLLSRTCRNGMSFRPNQATAPHLHTH